MSLVPSMLWPSDSARPLSGSNSMEERDATRPAPITVPPENVPLLMVCTFPLPLSAASQVPHCQALAEAIALGDQLECRFQTADC